jgi:NAD(P)-dependent dehydrogenase (short-subunit alcohol dehydrogenase family)
MAAMNLEGSAAIVTGGTRGIGLAIARALANKRMHVAICARDGAAAEQVADELRDLGAGKAYGASCDVADDRAVADFVDHAARAMGKLDVLVNNAGIGIFAPITELGPGDFRRVVETNLIGVFNFCHAAIPHMKRSGGGYIVNISSLAGKNPFAGGAAYNASKFALNGFSEAVMQDVRHDNIRVSYVMPGSVATEFGGNEAGAGEDWKLHPEDVAQVVVDLLRFDTRALPSRVEIRPSRPKSSPR